MRALRDGPSAARSEIGEPGGLEALARSRGARAQAGGGDVEVPYEAPDQETLEQAFLNDVALRGAPAAR